MRVVRYQGFSDDAVRAVNESPGYFMAWYSVKSIALVLVFGALCYQVGKSRR